jgi:GNAT superfamily N-acetyltransferase
MQCKYLRPNAFRLLPKGYSFRLCRRDELETWKRVVAEEQYVDMVTDFYNKVYAEHENEFFMRCLFVCDAKDEPVASCLIWRSYGLIDTVGWFRVLPEYEGQGIGRALLSKVFHTAQPPIYLHTQPTSMRAIKLYLDFGFSLITDPAIGYRKNDLDDCLGLFYDILPMNDFLEVRYTKANDALLNAALSREISEF